MNCTYHPGSQAHVRCSSCSRNLCPACDHRIKGYPYCQECIVAGVEMLGRRKSNHTDLPGTHEKTRSPLLATLLALVPGLGAAYNGQTSKALLHFFSVVTLWHLGDILSFPFAQVFLLGGLGFFIFTIFDARRSAQRYQRGADLRSEDTELRASLRRHAPLWGSALLGVGAISVLHFAFGSSLNALWPVLLVAAGFYLLRGFRDLTRPESRGSDFRGNSESMMPRNSSSTSGSYESTRRDYAGFEAGRFDRRR